MGTGPSQCLEVTVARGPLSQPFKGPTSSSLVGHVSKSEGSHAWCKTRTYMAIHLYGNRNRVGGIIVRIAALEGKSFSLAIYKRLARRQS